MALPDGHLENVCRMGAGEKCCAYLAYGKAMGDGEPADWQCAKSCPASASPSNSASPKAR